jgi:hypothetical protein
LPGGTRPVATPPATVPRKNGVTTEEAAKLAPKMRFSQRASVTLRKANAAPRMITPNAARVSGMMSVDITDANASGNPVQSTTTTKISQTWLASQIGPMECSIRLRWA